MKNLVMFVMGFGSLIIVIVLLISRIYNGVNFSMECTQYLKRAADANTVELAKNNLNRAVNYLEYCHLTNGVVSIFLKQPENDIGFWYSNLRASQDELNKVTTNTSQLEKANILMKLRETLTDNTKNGTAITCPQGISIYPRNKWYFYVLVIFGIYSIAFLTKIWDELLDFIADRLM